MSAPEFQLQKSICELFKTAYPQVLHFSVPNGAALCATGDPVGRQRAMREVSKLKVSGMLPGAPDLIIVWQGGWGALEIKADKGRVSTEQAWVHNRLRCLGHNVAIVRSLDDAIAAVKSWRMI